MEELVAGVDRIRFDVEADVEQQQGAQLLHFPGEDRLGVALCEFFTRGLSTRGECSGEDCPFPRVDATASTMGCPWYDRGFCRHGPLCRYKHTRRVMCANYLVGFCPDGPNCKFMHLKARLMMHSTDPAKCPPEPGICFKCTQKGHCVGKRGKNQMEILLRK